MTKELLQADLTDLFPWERQPGETKKAYAAFCLFRDAGVERTLKDVTAQDISRNSVYGWASKNEWSRRAEAYDRWLERRDILELERSIKAMRNRHANNAVVATVAAMNTIRKFLPDYDGPDKQEMTIQSATRLLDVATRMERLARGEPESINETKANVTVTDPDKKRKSMIAILNNPEAINHLERLSEIMGTDGSETIEEARQQVEEESVSE